jgi:hypothetical protein
MPVVMLIAFSFALSLNEPNPCNVRIAEIVKRIVEEIERAGCAVVIVAQWEVAMALDALGIPVAHVVFPVLENRYFNSKDVVEGALEYLRRCGVKIEYAIPVAQWGLHLWLCRRLMRAAGFKVLNHRIGKVGFYKKSLQPWTRSPVHLLWYAVSKCFGGDGIKAPESVDKQWREYQERRKRAMT